MLSTLDKIFKYDILKMYFSFFLENMIWHFMHFLRRQFGWNADPRKNKKNIMSMSSAEFAYSMISVNIYHSMG